MPRFFFDRISGDTALITGEDARHISRSLRMETGEMLTLCDMDGNDYRCRIESTTFDAVHVRIIEKMPSQSELRCRLRLYQAMPKADKLEFIIQKATELGVQDIVPVISARCISRPHVRAMERKGRRLDKIAHEAAKQSGRGIIPRVLPMQSFAEAVTSMREAELGILFYENCDKPLHEVLTGRPESISIMVGSEGGFSRKEVEFAREQGIAVASLGRRILRCETAPVCALSALLFYLGEF